MEPDQQANPNKMPKALNIYNDKHIISSSIPSESDNLEQTQML